MALVILSTGASSGSGLHTLRKRSIAGVAGVLLAGVLAGGFGLGFHLGQGTAQRTTGGVLSNMMKSSFAGDSGSDHAPGEATRTEAVIERIGSLTARMIRLESETVTLAKRVGAMPDADDDRAEPDDRPPGKSQTAAEPSGGPLLDPTADLVTEFADPRADLGGSLEQLEQELDRIETLVSTVADVTAARRLVNMAIPSLFPVESRRISSGFGNRRDPITHRIARHSGIDIPAPRGTPIQASAGGRVRSAGYRRAYGNTVEIDHGNGLRTRYAHASKLFVKTGELVLPGQQIAAVGSTGRSTGPHLHFEVIRDGTYVEPRQYLTKNDNQ